MTLLLISGCASFSKTPSIKLDVDQLCPDHIVQVNALIAKLEPFIKTLDLEGKLPMLTLKELEMPLQSDEKRFLCSFRDINPKAIDVAIPFRGFSEGNVDLVRLDGQKIIIKGQEKILPPQFLSPLVYQSYQFMMRAMEREIGKRLYVESGYRSSAYQLYLFIFYLSNHHYSIRETAKWVALPGYSEHGDPVKLAIDFINVDGINGEKNSSEFEILPEYRWLLSNADRFGFVLSYPKNSSAKITYEPWHWRYEGTLKR